MSSRPAAATEPGHVLLLQGPRLRPDTLLVPDGAVAVWCRDLGELKTFVRRLRPRCLIVEAHGSAEAVRVADPPQEPTGGRAIIVLVADGIDAPPGIDCVVGCDGIGSGAVTQLIRFALGFCVRDRRRTRCSGQATWTVDGESPREMAILDVSEDGVRVALPAGGVPSGRCRLLLRIGRGPELVAEAEHVRSSEGGGTDASAGFRFVKMSSRSRAALRAFILRSELSAASGPVREIVAARPSTEVKLIAQSPIMLRTLETLTLAAPTDATVLLLGETGTGKELAARYLHERSARADRAFVAVNCAALPDNLVEAELFGHEVGAFTGALRRKIGRIERASGGTLFLDEIGDLPLAAQAKLLRALQERQIERVGGTETIRVDIRLIAATNQDLEGEIARGAFRRDLFFRLNVVAVNLPPLRQRVADIPALSDHFLARAQRRMGKRDIRLNEHARESLVHYPWPGNVRELENLCTRWAALTPSGAVLGPEHIGLIARNAPANSPLPATELRDIVDYCEREIVRRMLDHNGGNRTKTARDLGISRQALQQKLSRYRSGDKSPSDDSDEAA